MWRPKDTAQEGGAPTPSARESADFALANWVDRTPPPAPESQTGEVDEGADDVVDNMAESQRRKAPPKPGAPFLRSETFPGEQIIMDQIVEAVKPRE